MINFLNEQLSIEDRKDCTPVQGRRTRPSQEYPDRLVHAVLEQLTAWIRQKDPARFNLYETFPTSQPSQDLSSWTPIMDHITETFQDTSKRPYYLDTSTDMGKTIADLFRMDLERIQVVWAPTTRRLATGYDFPYTHKGALIQYADGSRVLERKSLEEIRFPKQRFAKSVQAAIFVYGTARHEPELQPAAQADTDLNLLPLSSLPTDITFPNRKKDIPMEVRRLTARLHLNMGHPSSQELCRMLAYYGNVPTHVFEAAKALRCSTCERLRPPQPAKSSSTAKFLGQFGDQLQMDVVYVRTVNGHGV